MAGQGNTQYNEEQMKQIEEMLEIAQKAIR